MYHGVNISFVKKEITARDQETNSATTRKAILVAVSLAESPLAVGRQTEVKTELEYGREICESDGSSILTGKGDY